MEFQNWYFCCVLFITTVHIIICLCKLGFYYNFIHSYLFNVPSIFPNIFVQLAYTIEYLDVFYPGFLISVLQIRTCIASTCGSKAFHAYYMQHHVWLETQQWTSCGDVGLFGCDVMCFITKPLVTNKISARLCAYRSASFLVGGIMLWLAEEKDTKNVPQRHTYVS